MTNIYSDAKGNVKKFCREQQILYLSRRKVQTNNVQWVLFFSKQNPYMTFSNMMNNDIYSLIPAETITQ